MECLVCAGIGDGSQTFMFGDEVCFGERGDVCFVKMRLCPSLQWLKTTKGAAAYETRTNRKCKEERKKMVEAG